MDLKSGLNEVKQELSSDEKLLEQAFHLEKFFKKYKKLIIAAVVLILVGIVAYNVNSYLIQSRLEKANSAFLALEKNPKDSVALTTLKDNNLKLYALYSYSVDANSGDKEKLASIKSDDKFLQDVIAYHKSVLENKPKDSIYYKDLALVDKAYILIKGGKIKEAKDILIQISDDSALAPVARLLEHYTITK